MKLKELIPIYKTSHPFSPTCKFTVFTPLYNSEKTLYRVFRSLNKQTYRDFELILINDGSTDNSHDVALALIKTATFPVNYINNTVNKHKMSCLMQAVQVARGEYFLPFDADDECMYDALDIFATEYASIDSQFAKNCIAVTGLCIDQYGHQVGDKFPSTPFYSNTFISNNINKINGEKWGFTKTSILKGVQLHDDLFQKGLIPEGLIWNLLAKEGFITKYINVNLRKYYLNVENSITSSGIKNNALGTVIYNICNLNWFYKDYKLKTPLYFFKCIYFILKSSIYLDYRLSDYVKVIDSRTYRVLIVALWHFRKQL
ncbi:glycosyl transferase family 2 [Gelidibacter sediminis]|uniref:Glycosyl transferase family 2 n=1 Tax=Gelidibacter sediminis TaxID=1608710 RepID=A0A4R7PZW6_9FLAO|nr:glycosyltransferase family 2 protein [Gelidibacter sediminis]TDU40012.1 glycosyl transferase family 2 [Gelidibacter sediminis]